MELGQRGVDRDVISQAYEDFLFELHEEGEELDEMTMAKRETEKILRLADLSREEPIPRKSEEE